MVLNLINYFYDYYHNYPIDNLRQNGRGGNIPVSEIWKYNRTLYVMVQMKSFTTTYASRFANWNFIQIIINFLNINKINQSY